MAASNHSNHLGRFVDVGEEPRKLLQPIEGYQSLRLVSLEEAIEPIVEFCPDVRRRAYIAKGNCDSLKDGLTEDESASRSPPTTTTSRSSSATSTRPMST